MGTLQRSSRDLRVSLCLLWAGSLWRQSVCMLFRWRGEGRKTMSLFSASYSLKIIGDHACFQQWEKQSPFHGLTWWGFPTALKTIPVGRKMKRIRQTLRSGAHGKLRAPLTYNGLTAILEGREVGPSLSPDENSAGSNRKGTTPSGHELVPPLPGVLLRFRRWSLAPFNAVGYLQLSILTGFPPLGQISLSPSVICTFRILEMT